MIWVVVVTRARAPAGHQESGDEPDDEGAHHRRRHGHGQLLGRVVRPVDGRQARNQREAAAALPAVAVAVGVVAGQLGVAGNGRLELDRVLVAACIFVALTNILHKNKFSHYICTYKSHEQVT
jgi:hypothetical protein